MDKRNIQSNELELHLVDSYCTRGICHKLQPACKDNCNGFGTVMWQGKIVQLYVKCVLSWHTMIKVKDSLCKTGKLYIVQETMLNVTR